MADQDKLDKFVGDRVGDENLTKQEKDEIGKQAKSLKDVNVNLAFARMAVRFVKQKVKLVANWDEPLDSSAEGIYRVEIAKVEAQYRADLAAARSRDDVDRAEARAKLAAERAERLSKAAWDKADQCVYGKLRQEADWVRINGQQGGVQNLSDISKLANLADDKKGHGCGNCGELTSRTFMFLYNLNVRPLDFMALKNPGDHAFVVIGRKGSDKDDDMGTNWGKDAVVCDPWGSGLIIPKPAGSKGPISTWGDAYTAYPATLLRQNMSAMHSGFTGVIVPHREV